MEEKFKRTLIGSILAVFMFGAAVFSDIPEDHTLIYGMDFDAGIPTEWAVVDGYRDGYTWTSENPWGRSSEYWNGTFALIDNSWARFEDEDDVPMDDLLAAPIIDCSELDSVILRFSHQISLTHWGDASGYGKVEIKAGAASWLPVREYQITSGGIEEIDISEIAAGQAGVRIGWRYYTDTWTYYWGVDDVEIWGRERQTLTLSVPENADEDEGLLVDAGSVYLNSTLDTDLIVEIVSDDPSAVTVYGPVTIPAGSLSETFDIEIIDNDDSRDDRVITLVARTGIFEDQFRDIRIYDEDTDTDTLSDDWEEYYFGDLSQGADGDYDEDGSSNRMEYSRRTDPTDPLDFPEESSGDDGTKAGGCAVTSADTSSAILLYLAITCFALMAWRQKGC